MFIWCRDSCYSQAVDITIEEMPSCGVVLANAIVSQLLAIICVDGTSVGRNSNFLKKSEKIKIIGLYKINRESFRQCYTCTAIILFSMHNWKKCCKRECKQSFANKHHQLIWNHQFCKWKTMMSMLRCLDNCIK
jgi:hypothetical protein